MNTQTITIAYGIIFFAVGLLGFIENPVISSVGLFEVNTVHNIVHLILGVTFIWGVLKYPGHENKVLIIMGLGGIAVTILGFLTPGTMMLGIIHANEADHWLHLGLSIVILLSAFIFRNKPVNYVSHTA